MAYASVSDVQSRLTRLLTDAETAVCAAMLDDAAVLIDAKAPAAGEDRKKVVSCRMVLRAIGDGQGAGYPIGATQGSMGGLGYTQSWTVGGGGSVGELYLSKQDRQFLGLGCQIGFSPSPLEGMVAGND